MNITQTAENFNNYPSESKKQEVEANVEGISIDYGHYGASGTKAHEILLKEDTKQEPY